MLEQAGCSFSLRRSSRRRENCQVPGLYAVLEIYVLFDARLFHVIELVQGIDE